MTDREMLFVAGTIVLVLLLLISATRRIILGLVRIGFTLAAIGVAVAGLAMLMNNVTIYEPPGIVARVTRFLTVNHAASSKDGASDAACIWGDEPTPSPTPPGLAQAPPVVPTPTPTPAPGEEEPPPPLNYPELVQRSYPGIAPGRIFKVAVETVKSLGGWRIINEDPRALRIDAIYTTRVFGWQDDIRIIVTPRSEVEVCSRSRVAMPDSTSMLWWFPGDFGANVGHIKQFYESLEPRMELLYRAEEERIQKAPPPAPRAPTLEEFEAAPPPMPFD